MREAGACRQSPALFAVQIKDFTGERRQVEQCERFTLVDLERQQETGERTPAPNVKQLVIMEKYSNFSTGCTNRELPGRLQTNDLNPLHAGRK